MGRIKIPRCDNCGAPVEFAAGVFEARCDYCDEVLIREPPAPVVQAPLPAPVQQRYVPPANVSQGHKLWPIVIVIGATVAIAGASGIATFATSFKPLPAPAAEVRANVAAVPETRTESFSIRSPEVEANSSEPQKTLDAGTKRPRSNAPKTAAVVPTPAATPAEPPKPPKFDSQAAIAGLDAAKAKAEASCTSTTVKSLFVQMGFDPDGKNRGAALSNPKLGGTPEAKCVLKIFRAVRIPAFDPATRPSGLGRMVRL